MTKGVLVLWERHGKRTGENWNFLTSEDDNLRNTHDTKSIHEKYNSTHVIHLAALVGGLFKNMKYKLDFLRDNMLINDNVLECAKEMV
ncbi:unnamed protein product [Absidia cylindrospora]